MEFKIFFFQSERNGDQYEFNNCGYFKDWFSGYCRGYGHCRWLGCGGTSESSWKVIIMELENLVKN